MTQNKSTNIIIAVIAIIILLFIAYKFMAPDNTQYPTSDEGMMVATSTVSAGN